MANDYGVKSLVLLVNQALDTSEAGKVHKKLQMVCDKHLGVEIKFGGGLMKDPNLERSVRERRPVYIAHPQTPVSQNLRQIAKGFDRVFTAGKNDRAARNFWGEVFAQRGG